MEIHKHPVLGEYPEEERVNIIFEDTHLSVRRNQKVAAALMAKGVFKLGQSRNLVKPRGVFCANGRCCNCYMVINGKHHVKSCMTTVEENMEVKLQNNDPNI